MGDEVGWWGEDVGDMSASIADLSKIVIIWYINTVCLERIRLVSSYIAHGYGSSLATLYDTNTAIRMLLTFPVANQVFEILLFQTAMGPSRILQGAHHPVTTAIMYSHPGSVKHQLLL